MGVVPGAQTAEGTQSHGSGGWLTRSLAPRVKQVTAKPGRELGRENSGYGHGVQHRETEEEIKTYGLSNMIKVGI